MGGASGDALAGETGKAGGAGAGELLEGVAARGCSGTGAEAGLGWLWDSVDLVDGLEAEEEGEEKALGEGLVTIARATAATAGTEVASAVGAGAGVAEEEVV